MIKFKKISTKEYNIFCGDNIDDYIKVKLSSSTITNKFHIITNFIENLSLTCSDFSEWFYNFLIEYESSSERYKILEREIDNIKKFVDDYFEIRNVDFSQFVDESKAKKNSILFNVDEIKEIVKLSGYLKVYSVISNNEHLKLDHRSHKEIYNKLSCSIMESEVVFKIFNIVKTKTFRYNMTDKFMWDYIKTVQCKTIDVHVIEIFNFIMNSIIILCEEDRNPIIYFIGVIEESVKWFLRSVYKGSIIYSDTVSTEDIQSPNIDNLKTYSYNDTLGNLKGIAYEKIYNLFEKEEAMLFEETVDAVKIKNVSDEKIVDFQNRVMSIQYISPLCECLVFPILSKLTNIPYNHFKTLSEDHSAILSIYVQNLMKKVFKNDYKNLITLLEFYPKEQGALVTTYKIKTMPEFLNFSENVGNFFGFKTKLLLGHMLSHFIGRTSRSKFISILDGRNLGGIPLSKVEREMIYFYTLWFAGKLEPEFDEMKKLIENDF